MFSLRRVVFVGIIIFFLSSTSFDVSAEVYDTVAPSLENIEFSKESVKAGDEITVYITASDDNSGIKEIGWFVVRNPSKNSGVSSSSFTKDEEGRWMATLKIPSDAENGLWSISSIGISDNTGNYFQTTDFSSYSFDKGFTVEAGTDDYDTVAPSLENIEFSKESVKAGDEITVYITASDDNSGIKEIGWFVVRNPSKNSGVSSSSFTKDEEGRWMATLKIPSDAENGLWSISSIGISDNTGNYFQTTDFSSYSFDKGFTVTQPVTGLVDNTDENILYQGNWHTALSNNYNNGSLHYGGKNSLEFSFEGNRIQWTALTSPYYGLADVFIDDILVEEVNLYSSSAKSQQVVFEKTNLTTGHHTLRIVNKSTKGNAEGKGTNINVDSFLVSTSTPVTGSVDNTDENILYQGNWHTALSNNYNNGSLHYGGKNSLEFSFEGNRIQWTALTSPYYGLADVFIDDILVEEVNLYSSSAKSQQVVFEKTNLTTGHHTLRIVNKSTKGNAEGKGTNINVDSFLISY